MVIAPDHLDASTTTPPSARTAPVRRWRGSSRLGTGVGVSLLSLYLSLTVLVPLAAVISHGVSISVAARGSAWWPGNWRVGLHPSLLVSALALPGARSAVWLSLWLSLLVATINSVAGVVVALVLTRDRFRGRALLDAVVDLPFALPTVVAGVVLLGLYGADSPIHVNLFETTVGLLVALLFVTLPLTVRTVQPAVHTIDREAEQAARTLGASEWRTFRTTVLPTLYPAMLSGFGLAFSRAIGEFGSISLISGGLGRTTLASAYLFGMTQNFQWDQAASVATLLLLISTVVLVTVATLARRHQARLARS